MRQSFVQGMRAVSAAPDIHAVWGRNTARRQQPEARFHRDALAFLRESLPIGAVVHHSPGEGKRTPRAQAELIASGHCKGWPDLEIVYQGRVYFLELKAARGVLSTAQKNLHRRLAYTGAPVAVCKTLEDVERGLREAGVPLRASVAA